MPPKRAKKRKAQAQRDVSDEPGNNEPTEQVVRTRSVRGRRGSLADLPKMPLDIICEILAYIHPLDLLHLARTSKAFRDLLMSRSSLVFWKAARRNVDGLPDCPPSFSEPAYACMAFESSCNECSKHNANPVSWDIGVRLCNDCLRKLTQRGVYDLPDRPSDAALYGIYREVVLPKSYCGSLVLKSEVEAVRTTWLNTTPDKRLKLIQERKSLVEQLESFGKEFSKWDKARRETRSGALAELKRIRQEAVLQKLRDLGWGEELERVMRTKADSTKFLSHSGVKESRELSERAWKRMEPGLVAFLEDFKRGGLVKEQETLLGTRFRLLRDIVPALEIPYANIFPTYRELALHPDVRTILYAPKEVNITSASFGVLKPKLPDLVSNWKTDATAELVEDINAGACVKLSSDADLESLALGTFYYCTAVGCRYNSRGLMTDPSVLAHECASSAEITHDADVYTTLVERHFPLVRPSYAPWIFQAMKNIIEAYGYDATEASPEQMDRSDVRLLCASEDCKDEEHYQGVRAVYTWRSAMQHVVVNGRGSGTFRPLSRETIQVAWDQVRSLEESASEQAASAVEKSYHWQCKLCTGLIDSDACGQKNSVVAHILKKTCH